MRATVAVATLLTGALLLGGACSSERESLPDEPKFSLQAAPALDDQIATLIQQLFPPPGLLVDALARFQAIKLQVQGGKIAAARAMTLNLVSFTLTKYAAHRLIGNQSTSTRTRVRSLVDLLFQFVGLGAAPIPPDALGPDGAVAVVGPAGGQVVTGTGFAGVLLPPGAVSENVVVTINRDPNQVNPLPTGLPQFPLFYDFQTFPAVPHFGQTVNVGVCVLDEFIPEGRGPFLRLAHTVPAGEGSTIEILPKVAVPFLNCTGASLGLRHGSAHSDLASIGPSLAKRFLWLMMGAPRDLQAEGRRIMMPGGLGGAVKSFSPFGAVDPGAGPATQLVFGVQPSTTTVGAAITPPVRVAAVNAVGDTDVAFTGNITVAITPGTGTPAAALAGTLTRAAVNGIAVFSGLSIDSVGFGYTLTASSSGLTPGTSAAFDITPLVSWTALTSGTSEALYSVWGSSASDVFAVGGSVPGTILHFDGSSWSSQPSTFDSLFGVWGTGSSDVFAVGYAGDIVHFDGSSWTRQSLGLASWLFGVWGTSGSDVFAVGRGGAILHYDGSTWAPQASGTSQTLRGVWGSSSSNVFAVGEGGTILHYDGSGWTPQASGTTNDLNGVWGATGSDVFAVSSSGVFHYNGSTWSPSPCCAGGLGVWGTTGSNVFVVGVSGIILHFDGFNWVQELSGTSNTLFGVWGASATDVFAVGIGGKILRRAP